MAALGVGALPRSVNANTYPEKPVRLIAPFAPGGGADTYARLLGASLQGLLGQPFVIENEAGASGTIAMQRVARSAKDGYTLILGSPSGLSTAPQMQARPPYELRDFTPIAEIARFPFFVFVNSELPVENWQDLVALSKKRQLNYATAGVASTPHLIGEKLKELTRVEMTDVPYKGSGPAFVALMSDEVQLYIDVPLPGTTHVKSGRVKAFCVLGPQRSRLIPSMPTLAEMGFPGIEATNRYTLLAPSGTPAEVVRRLDSAVKEASRSGGLRDRHSKDDSAPPFTTAEQLSALLREDEIFWLGLLNNLGIRRN